MGTRGTYGFRKGGVDKVTYNHFDSYPSYLGANMVKLCLLGGEEVLNTIFDKIVLVNENAKPAKKYQEYIEKYGDKIRDDYYVAIRNHQGNTDLLLRLAEESDVILMTDGAGFIEDSLFCEYGYIVNLDTHMLEVWRGFQRKPDEGNRYGTKAERNGYYPCKLVLELPLNNMGSLHKAVDKMEKACV